VLPVIVSGLNLFGSPQSKVKKKPTSNISRLPATLVVQEPEIHLHPNAQAALGSFFAGISSTEGQLFIETHSDNLVLRLARHVALGDLDEGHVTIFFVRDEEGAKVVTAVRPTPTVSMSSRKSALRLSRALHRKQSNIYLVKATLR
jgi:predicted ATP-dependent endonuclease of OLD family